MSTKTTNSAQSLLMRQPEAAQLLAMSQRKLHDLTAPKGPIPVVRLPNSRALRYSRLALERWIEDQIK